jgi:hypothetical protein
VRPLAFASTPTVEDPPMDRRTIELRIDELACQFGKTGDKRVLRQIEDLCRELKAYRIRVKKVADLDPGASKTAMDCVICGEPMDMDDIRNGDAVAIGGEIEDCIVHKAHFLEQDEHGSDRRTANAEDADDKLIFEYARRNGLINWQ